MFVGSHYRIGTFVYKSVITKFQKGTLINQFLFKCGNVLPDVHHKLAQVDHHLEFTLDYVKDHIKIFQDQSIPSYRRSISLGIVCHFISDYFCTYHALAPYKNHSTLKHLIYELKLHLHLCYYLLFPKQLQEKLAINIATKYPDIQTMIHTIQRDYFKEKTCIMNDILFSLRASSIAVAHLQENPVISLDNVIEMMSWSQTGYERSYQ
ncbi:MAG: zinc dependent phospholipase C family protein [Vallitaleaceae bacterium]|nr:zinc dependent phospholipase C family protein [Vallitaleaceae bacterium]